VSRKSIFVGQVPFDATEEELHEIFKACGAIHHVRIPRNEKGQSRGIAYVTFQEEEAVEFALKFNKATFKKQTILVQRSNPAKGEKIKKKHEEQAEQKMKSGKKKFVKQPKQEIKTAKRKKPEAATAFEGMRAKPHEDNKNQSIKTYLKLRAHIKRKRDKSAGQS
jgi:nucleolar protein 12